MTTTTREEGFLDLELQEDVDAERRAVQEAEEAEAFRPSAAGWAARIGFVAVILAGIFSLPVILPFPYQADLVSLAAVFAIVGLSMNVLTGYLGQLSLGHQAFYGIGAFASAIVATTYGLPFVAGLAAGALTGMVTALLLGYIALRVKGLYLAIVTLAYGLLAQFTIFQIGFLSAGVPADKPIGFTSPRLYAYICLGFLALFFLLDVRLLKSKAGRAILAIRDNEQVAASFGINVTSHKLLAFMISGTMAGIAGALFAHMIGNVVSDVFNLLLALTFVLMTVVGGLGNRVGVIMGSIIFAVLHELLDALVDSVFHNIPFLTWIPAPNPVFVPVIGALLLVLTLISFPGGIGQQLAPTQNWVRGGRFDLHAIKNYEAFGAGGGSGVRP